MKFDTMLAGLEDAPAHARRLEGLGVDGAFTFEGPHDVFTPLILAAGATKTLELATNVAIAFPRNPVQLAHRPTTFSCFPRAVHLGLGSQIELRSRSGTAPGSIALSPVSARWSGHACHLRHVGDRGTTGLPGRVLVAHSDAAALRPRSEALRPPAIALGGLGPQMLRLAAELGDTVFVMPFNTAAHFVEHSLPAIEEGLSAEGGIVRRSRWPVRSLSAADGTRRR